MSFGFETRHQAIHDAIELARSHNIIMLAAAANDGARRKAAWPATHESVIGVHSANGDGRSSDFTPSTNPKLEDNFATLGEAIDAPWVCYQIIPESKRSHGTKMRRSGTSYATPVLASIVAAVLYYVRLKLPKDEITARARTRAGMLSILRLEGMCDLKKSPGYAFVTPWTFWERTETHVREQLLDALRNS